MLIDAGLLALALLGQAVKGLLPGVADSRHQIQALIQNRRVLLDVGLYEEMLEVLINTIQILRDLTRFHVQRTAQFCDDVLGTNEVIVHALILPISIWRFASSARLIAPLNSMTINLP